MAHLVTATVKFAAGKAFAGQYGRNRQNVVLSTEHGDFTKWFDEGDRRWCNLRKGEEVQLLVDGDRVSIVEASTDEPGAIVAQQSATPTVAATPQPTAAQAQPQQPRTPSEELQFQIIRRARIISSCHAQVASCFTNERGELLVTEDCIQKYVSGIFISLDKDNLF